MLRAGADKVSVNSAAVRRPELVRELASEFGSQCVVISVDARAVPDRPGSWEVVVFKDDSANAFALPGRKIGVNSGMLKVAKNQHQLATVVGHEVAHVADEHDGGAGLEAVIVHGHATGRSREAQRQARFHYQYIVWNDFLRQICDPDVYTYLDNALRAAAEKYNTGDPKYDPQELFKLTDECGRPLMPVEFSVAAYRFGHVTVRSNYPVNRDAPVIELFDDNQLDAALELLGHDHVRAGHRESVDLPYVAGAREDRCIRRHRPDA